MKTEKSAKETIIEDVLDTFYESEKETVHKAILVTLKHSLVSITEPEKVVEREITHYELIKEFPYSFKLGNAYYDKNNFEMYSQYPEFYKPIYAKEESEVQKIKNIINELNQENISLITAIQELKQIFKK